jgi:hypothetical protein
MHSLSLSVENKNTLGKYLSCNYGLLRRATNILKNQMLLIKKETIMDLIEFSHVRLK